MSSLFVLGGTLLYSFNWLNMVKGYSQHKMASFGEIIPIVLIVRIIFSIYRIKRDGIILAFSLLDITLKDRLLLIKEILSKYL